MYSKLSAIMCSLFFSTAALLFPVVLLAQTAGNPVKRIKNIRYAPLPPAPFDKDSSCDRTLDLYIPQEPAERKVPVLIFVHGGGFAGGDKRGNATLCEKLAQSGIAVVAVNYRLYLKYHKNDAASAGANMAKGLPAGGHFHPELEKAIEMAAGDVALAMQWLKNNAALYSMDAGKMMISGGSAGAMTALYVAYVKPALPLKISGVIDFWGGLEDASVIKRNAPPVLVYHGSSDKVINVAYAHALQQRMAAAGNRLSEFHIMEGKGHAAYRIIETEKSEEVVSFIRKIFDLAAAPKRDKSSHSSE
ncbi:alpha/beta hydrolase [Niabella beijingensis]|uniref:alpha/beta hydrolase n=1 Tax=Niabella beijingensis TaxID=2872700 RepID=UPI001CBB3B36|nr:alpha/beta hydrolase [Niabella beijingensis]MBZ4188600.1 alpha/beta hydrolase [Niabella beijingensis]